MEEKELRTSTKQRIFIGVIAVLMIVLFIATYVAIVLAGNSSNNSEQGQIDEAKVAEYQQQYGEKQAAFTAAAQADFDKFAPYRSSIVAYNETSANEGGVAVNDLLVGEGRELTDGDHDYMAYYVGWCADETIFDSTFNSNTNPTGFSKILDVSDDQMSPIEGWVLGVQGMKLGGIREITIPGELAYKDSMEICGGTYKPLKFLVMAVENGGDRRVAYDDLTLALQKLRLAEQGIDYDAIIQSMEAAQSESSETTETTEEPTDSTSN